MLLLVSVYVFRGLDHLLLVVVNSCTSVIKPLLCLVQVLLHIATSRNSLDSQSLLALKLVLEVISFTYKSIVLLHCTCHFFNCFVLLFLAIESEHSFSSEHSG